MAGCCFAGDGEVTVGDGGDDGTGVGGALAAVIGASGGGTEKGGGSGILGGLAVGVVV